MHVEWMKTQDDWKKDGGGFVPMPVTYLNQQRWLDWVAPKPVKSAPDVLETLKAHKGAPMPAAIRDRINQLRGARA